MNENRDESSTDASLRQQRDRDRTANDIVDPAEIEVIADGITFLEPATRVTEADVSRESQSHVTSAEQTKEESGITFLD